MLGTVNIVEKIYSAHKLAIQWHQRKNNRSVSNQIINVIRFRGKRELVLRGHDEKEGSENPSIFRSFED